MINMLIYNLDFNNTKSSLILKDNTNEKILTICLASNLNMSETKCIQANCVCYSTEATNLLQNNVLNKVHKNNKRLSDDFFSMFFCLSNWKTRLRQKESNQTSNNDNDCKWKNCNCEAIENEIQPTSTPLSRENDFYHKRPVGVDQIFLTLSMITDANAEQEWQNDKYKNRFDTLQNKSIWKREEIFTISRNNLKNICLQLLNLNETEKISKILCSAQTIKENQNISNVKTFCSIKSYSQNLAQILCNERFIRNDIGKKIMIKMKKKKRNIFEKNLSNKLNETLNEELGSKSDSLIIKIKDVEAKRHGEKCTPGDVCLNGTSCIKKLCD